MKAKIRNLLLALFVTGFLTGCGGGGSSSSNDPQLPDTTPSVVSTNPAHESVSVPTNRAVTVTFNKSVNPTSINPETFLLRNVITDAPVSGEPTYDENSRTAAFRTNDLAPATTYRATVTSQIADMNGRRMTSDYSWQFTTAAETDDILDETRPSVLNTFPASDATAVPLNTSVLITFSEALDPTTINNQTYTLWRNGTEPVTGTISYVGTTAAFKPNSPLSANTVYSAEVTTAIQDLAGNALQDTFRWSFTTETLPAPPLEPLVESVFPAPGEQNVPINSPIVVVFDVPIMPFEFGLIDGRPVAVTFNSDYTIVTMTPTVNLRPGRTYTASIRVSDIYGNRMDEAFVWQFSTQP